MLPTYQNILVATDFTENSENAFKHAVMLARLNDAKIHLMHVVPQVDSSMRSYLGSVMGQDKLEEFEKRNAQEAHAEIKQDLDRFIKTELAGSPEDLQRFAGAIVAVGNPVLKILETADKVNADVIVLGTHSKGALEHAFLGSVAEKVLQKSQRPTFVIPLPKR